MITIVGTGRVGISAAIHLALRELDDLMLIDIVEGLPQGEALDLNHMCSMLGLDIQVRGSNHPADMAGSQLVIVPAGFIRTAEMTRLELLHKNAQVIRSVGENIAKYAPQSKVIVVTNPLDVMTYLMYKITGFGRNRVLGFSGLLDTARFKQLISSELGISSSSIQTMVLGEHGDSMVLLPRFSWVGSQPLDQLIPQQRISELIQQAKQAGSQIIKLKKHSASHAVGAGIGLMAEAMIKDRKSLMPCSVYLQGEYGVSDVCATVPVILGADGVERIIELPLNSQENQEFLNSIQILKQAISQLPT